MGSKTVVNIGDRYNRWTVVGEPFYKEYLNSFPARYVNCVCDCGTEKQVKLAALTSPSKPSISCGCFQKEITRLQLEIVEIGTVFERLTVIENLGLSETKKNTVVVQCSCGSPSFSVRLNAIKQGNTKSCGCLQKEVVSNLVKTHGMTGTSAYGSWQGMKNRCTSPNNCRWDRYGGRGISYPEKWETFDGFWEDMSEGWYAGADIDRIDFNLNYCKENCRWADRDVGNHNKSKAEDCTSEYKGVYYDKARDKWVARINRNGKVHLQKRFNTELEAALAYDNASEEIYGDRPNKTIKGFIP